jgi:replicative DNA helicase
MIATEALSAIDSERSLLGSILLNNELIDQSAGLEPPAFALDSHQQIFRTMQRMWKAGVEINTSTLIEALINANLLSSVGSRPYIFSLTEGVPRTRNMTPFVDSVREKWQKRQLVKICEDYSNRASAGGEEVAELIAAADKDLLGIAADGQDEWPSVELQTHQEMALMADQRSGRKVMGYRYGIPALDRLVIGVVPSEMTVLGGRPQQGKSSLIAQLVSIHCPQGIPVHVFSYEMRAGQFLRRLWAIVSGVPFNRVRNPDRLTDEENKRVEAAALRVSTWPLTLDDSSALTADQLCARARISKRRQGTAIVCVDYLQKMRFNNHQAQRYLDVTAACVAMAGLAKDESLALLLLSSVSEKNGRGRNDAPTLQDFRQSGDIAYEASTALLIHREIDDETEQPKQDGMIIVAKGRSDAGGAVRVWFNTETLTFQGGGQH